MLFKILRWARINNTQPARNFKRNEEICNFKINFALQNLSEKSSFLKIINEHFQVRLLFEIFFEIYRKPRIMNTVI